MAQNEDIIDVPQQAKAPSDVKRSLRTGMWVLGLGFGGFILWGVTVPLDEGVPSPATIAVETHSKQIQHPTGGVVAKVNVTEGQKVVVGPYRALTELKDDVAVVEEGTKDASGNLVGRKAGESAGGWGRK